MLTRTRTNSHILIHIHIHTHTQELTKFKKELQLIKAWEGGQAKISGDTMCACVYEFVSLPAAISVVHVQRKHMYTD